MSSRRPMALGAAPVIVEPAPAVTPVAETSTIAWTAAAAWIIAGLAALALIYALATDLFAGAGQSTASLVMRRQSVGHR
jgi:hypothetical protein